MHEWKMTYFSVFGYRLFKVPAKIRSYYKFKYSQKPLTVIFIQNRNEHQNINKISE